MLYRLDKISSSNDVSDINEDNSPNKKIHIIVDHLYLDQLL